MPTNKISLTLSIALAILFWSSAAGAGGGNQDGYFLDDTASMTGGAVIATVSGGGAVWYNPAGLVKEKGHSIDLTATVYSAKKYTVNDFLVTEFDDVSTSEPADFTEYLAAPTVLTYVRDLGDGLAGGFTVSVQRLTDIELRTHGSASGEVNGETRHADFGISITTLQSTYYAGPALGWAVSPDLRLGVSVLGFYQSIRGTEQQSLSTDSDLETLGNDGFLVLNSVGGSKYLGLRPIIGVQWTPAPAWDLGLSVRAPMMVIWESSDYDLSVSAYSSSDATGVHRVAPEQERGFSFDMIEPARALAGVSHKFTNGNTIEIGGDIAAPIEPTSRAASDWVVNGRVGALFPLSDTLVLGSGLFTDLSSVKTDEFGETKINYFGGTIGLEITTPYELADGSTLRFVTTMGGMLQVGTGHVVNAIIRPAADGTIDVATGRADATFVEGGLNLGLKTRF